MWNGALSIGTGLSSSCANTGCTKRQASAANDADRTYFTDFLPSFLGRIVHQSISNWGVTRMWLQSNRRTFCIGVAGAVLSVPAVAVAAPAAGAPPALRPGLHRLTFQRPGEPTVGYAMFIPDNYSPSKAVPLILALH